MGCILDKRNNLKILYQTDEHHDDDEFVLGNVVTAAW